jgi:para-nitrobenzyl esterase
MTRYPYPVALIAGVLSLGPSAFAQTPQASAPGDPVRIDSGLISGKLVSGEVRAYLGIPFAAPPVGGLRWREPQPVKPWTGVRAADQYGAPCTQRGAARGGPAYTEDCLFLNLWAPVKPAAKKLPVIVYIYGGGYTGGSASSSSFSGEVLARKGAVYVNFNYRLSVLGSLGLPELTAESPHKASSNYVHLDGLAVLQWVHRNIAAFGGDPGNVTLMGQSSGAMEVCYLQGSPLTKGLIHRVLAMSGSTFPGGPWGARKLKDVETAGAEFKEKLGVKTLAELRALPWERLLETSWIDINEPAADDGYLASAPTPQMFAAHKQNDVPAIVEWCRDEVFSTLTGVRTLADYKAAVEAVAGSKAGEMLKLFPASNDEEARQAAQQAARWGATAKQMIGWAVAQSAAKSPVYVSTFSYGQSAGHGKDVAYWHGTVATQGAAPGGRGPQLTPHDAELAEQMSDALIAFAKTGNPNTVAVKWPKFDSRSPSRLDFGERIEPAPIDPAVFFYLKNPDVKMDFPKGGRAGARGGPGAPGGPQPPGR